MDRGRRRDEGSTARALSLTVAGLGLVAALLVGAVLWWNGGVGRFVGRERCVAQAGGTQVELSLEQAQHAATIVATAARRELPPRAATVALATAYQESDLVNLPTGDRDSAGLFQQRPSQGWGTLAQVTDPQYATQRFYDALLAVPDWQSLPVTTAAQAVQRSAYPAAYQQHVAEAAALSAAFGGRPDATLTCTVRQADVAAQPVGRDGLTTRARLLREALAAERGPQSFGGLGPGAADRPGTSAQHNGCAFDVLYRPHTDAEQRRAGWATARWLVANADRFDVSVVIYRDRVWSAQRSPEGWRDQVSPPRDPRNPPHRSLDHVHVEVAQGVRSSPA